LQAKLNPASTAVDSEAGDRLRFSPTLCSQLPRGRFDMRGSGGCGEREGLKLEAMHALWTADATVGMGRKQDFEAKRYTVCASRGEVEVEVEACSAISRHAILTEFILLQFWSGCQNLPRARFKC
jgi:hypothetical protein